MVVCRDVLYIVKPKSTIRGKGGIEEDVAMENMGHKSEEGTAESRKFKVGKGLWERVEEGQH